MPTLDQIIEKVKSERGIESRFPVRLIFTDNLDLYEKVVAELLKNCDIVKNVAEFCSSDDIYPNFRNLHNFLVEHKGKQILLLSMGEYLRFRAKREVNPEEAKFPSLWQLQFEASSTTKILIPMFACKDLFDRVVPYLDDRQIDFIWVLNSDQHNQKPYYFTIYPKAFENSIVADVKSFRQWLLNWFSVLNNSSEVSIVTALFSNIENTNGVVNTRVIENPYVYITTHVTDGIHLQKDWASDDQWSELIPYLKEDFPLRITIEKILNINEMDPLVIMAQWDLLSKFKKQLVWIWYQLVNTDDYAGFVFRSTAQVENIKDEIRDKILQTPNLPDWIDQRNKLLSVLKDVTFDKTYFNYLDSLPLPESRLNLLTYTTHDERAFAIYTISKWLKQNVLPEVVAEALRGRYSLFETYLLNDVPDHSVLQEYFSWYKKQKIMNQVPAHTPPYVNLEEFDSRFSLLDKFSGKDCYVIWVDGLGVEWLPLLLNQIEVKKHFFTVKHNVATALLPTETSFNKQWENFDFPYEKLNRLDELAHKGLPDDKGYFSCIVTQLTIISEIATRAVVLLQSHEFVIITGDHGSSRIAALAFHKSFGIDAPKKAVPKSFGRYCELNGPLSPTDLLINTHKVKVDNKVYLVMTNHDHYKISGNPAGGNDEDHALIGEIHGGMTPEEYLVPVVVLRNQNFIPQLECSLMNSVVFREAGKATIELQFSSDVSKLEVRSRGVIGSSSKINSKLWSVTFNDIDLRDYIIDMIANDRLLDTHLVFTVKSKGISVNNDPFGEL